MAWICRITLAVLLVAYVVALTVALIGTQGLFGIQPDGLAAVYLILLGMPWSLLLWQSLPLIVNQTLIVILPLLNVLVIWLLCRRRRRG